MIRRITGSRSALDDSNVNRAPGHLVPDIERARAVLHFETTISLREGLQDFCDRTTPATVRTA
jgi:nucleoside-diphosphate-sugar epimerase